jgi:hypothetical protein
VARKQKPKKPPEGEPFPGDSPRWREVPDERESEKERRAHDRDAPGRDIEGAIDRPPASPDPE